MDEILLQMLRFTQQGYNCSQIMLLLGLDARAEENPGLVRAMAGLAYGCGTGEGTCGALSGACCLMAYCAANAAEAAQADANLPVMLQELVEWFTHSAGGLSCAAITGAEGPAAARQRCGQLVADTYLKVMEILSDNGFA